MNELREGIYICFFCKAFICKKEELFANQLPSSELDNENYTVLNKFENLCYNLDFTKKIYINSDCPPLAYCGVFDLNCNRCKQKLGLMIVSTTAQISQLRDKLLIMKDKLIFNEVEVKQEKKQKEFEKKKSLLEMQIEENVDDLQQTLNKCKERFGTLCEFFQSLQVRLDVIETQNMTLQTILFNLAKIALQQKLKIKGKGQATKSYNQSPDEKVLLEFKLPKKTARDQEDFQKFYFPSFPDSSEKTKKRKREDEEEKQEVYETKQNYNYKPKKKLLKLNK